MKITDVMRNITVAAIQLALGSEDQSVNIDATSGVSKRPLERVLISYCHPSYSPDHTFVKWRMSLFSLARPTQEHASVKAMRKLARKLAVAILLLLRA